MGTWITYDAVLLIAGTLAAVAALFVRRLRPLSLIMAMQSLVLFTGGYVPFMQVLNLLPWAALLVAAIGAKLADRLPRRAPSTAVHAGLAVTLVAASVALWLPRDRDMMTATQPQGLRAAEAWIGADVPDDRTVIVHDALFTDLVTTFGFAQQNVIIVYKFDSDPTVNKGLHHIDYLVVPDFYYLTPSAKTQYPTVLAARDRAVAVAHFGSNDTHGITVYRVSAGWSPR
jgi:hypothetical protein